MCPLGAGSLVAHVLAIESGDGIVLVDTGLGTAVLAEPAARLGRLFTASLRPRLDPAETARAQLAARGLDPAAVQHIVLTHLDPDHAGGLSDFPDAMVHVHDRELAAAERKEKLIEKLRYRSPLWSHGPRWAPFSDGGEAWQGFAGARALDGLPPEILVVPLCGHTRGHTGVAVRDPAPGGGWLLHAGDAFFHHGELEPRRRCPLPLRLVQRIDDIDREARFANQARLRALAHDATARVRIFCAHDPAMLPPPASRRLAVD
jgi:glyoxylase-like metal-dependent hydrolase (beta-lactamase superfamily II)